MELFKDVIKPIKPVFLLEFTNKVPSSNLKCDM